MRLRERYRSHSPATVAFIDSTELSQNKHRVLHVFGRMDRGGAELRTIDLLRQAALNQFEFHFATLAGGRGTLDDEIMRLGGCVHPCRLTEPGFGRRFRRLLRDINCEVVHSHVHYFSGYLLRLAAQVGVPTRIAHFWSTGDGKTSTVIRRIQRGLMKRWIDRYATALAAVGEGAMQAAWRTDWASDERCTILYGGIDLSQFDAPREKAGVRREFGMPLDSVLIIHIGSFSSNKNQSRLVRIFDEFQQIDQRARLLLVGRDGDGTAERLSQDIQARHMDHLVTMAGERADVVRLLKAADVMIFPSAREGLPGAVLEACAAGIPVVASDLPGAREIAAVCSLVTCVSLDADDQHWVEAAKETLHAVLPSISLVGSQFDVGTAADQLARLYEAHRE
jgi:glycosyltransferase involved in cell wall biosynthesis